MKVGLLGAGRIGSLHAGVLAVRPIADARKSLDFLRRQLEQVG
jgi:hypothetical protein